MASMLVTCPESGHLEEIDLDVDVLGLLVKGCTAFVSSCGPACPRTCAARLDRKRRTKQVELVGAVLEARSCLR